VVSCPSGSWTVVTPSQPSHFVIVMVEVVSVVMTLVVPCSYLVEVIGHTVVVVNVVKVLVVFGGVLCSCSSVAATREARPKANTEKNFILSVIWQSEGGRKRVVARSDCYSATAK
jgi:hypothetical protein